MTVTLKDGYVVDFSKDGVPKMDERFTNIEPPAFSTPENPEEECAVDDLTETRDFFAENPEKDYIRKPDGSVEEVKSTFVPDDKVCHLSIEKFNDMCEKTTLVEKYDAITGYGETPQPGNIIVSNFEEPHVALSDSHHASGQTIIDNRVHTTGYIQPAVSVPMSGLPDDYKIPPMQLGHYHVTQTYPTDAPVKGYFPSEVETIIKTRLNTLKEVHKKISVTKDDENTLLIRLVADHANMTGYIEALEYVLDLLEGR